MSQGCNLNNAIIIPAYNEATTIGGVVESVGYAGKVIVVDDGSTDLTAEIAMSHGATVVHHSYNLGYDSALQSGFREAESLGISSAITFDADEQHDPEVLKQFIYQLEDRNKELVIGIREKGARIAETVFNHYVNYRYDVPDILCGVKGYQMCLYKRLGWFSSYESVGTELALFGLRKQSTVSLVKLDIYQRQGAPRFGNSFRANRKLIGSLYRAVRKDIVNTNNIAN